MFQFFAVASLLLNWRKRVYGVKGVHRMNRRRDGKLNIWVGVLNGNLQKRIYWKKRGSLAYQRFLGEVPFPTRKPARIYA